jgi:hypothetical protein
MSASTAGTVTSSVSAISWYERPSSSRIAIAARWLNGSRPSAFRSSRTLGRSLSGTESWVTTSSSGTSRGRRDAVIALVRQALWAIVISQFCGLCGRSPRLNAR